MKALTKVSATLVTFPKQQCKMAAIEDDGRTKTATDDTLFRKMLRTMLTHAQLATQRQRETLFLQESRLQKSLLKVAI